jgi:cellulose synthase/poly-beta-1,6-N-acetylglucosamine synthase-like glycosyltransferase
MNQADKWYAKIGCAHEIKNPRDRRIYRLFELIPGILSWGTIFGLLVLSYFVPTFVAIFIIIFDVYWLSKSVLFSIHLISSYREIKKRTKINWLKKMQRKFGNKYLGYKHLIILPTYKEGYDLIRKTFKAIAGSNYPLSTFIVVLAIEGDAEKEGREVAEKIEKEFGDKFFKFMVTVHPSGLPNEIPGKGSNETWAVRRVKEEVIDKMQIPYEKVIVSVFDIDTRPFPNYFGILMYEFLSQKDPLRASYQPIPVFHNNVWKLPPFSRIVAFSTTFWQMMQQKRAHKLATFSSHSMSFKSLVEMDFWQTNIVSEDSRIFWQSILHYDGDYKVVPLFYPVSMDACLGRTHWETAVNQYKQQRRWAWGAENIPYILFGFMKNKKIALHKKIYFAVIQMEGFWSWATSAVIIMFLGWLPILLGGEKFTSTILSYNLPHITSNLMILAMIGLITSAAVSNLLLPPPPKNFRKWKHIFLVLEWILIPITVNIFGVIPSLDAQTRLFFGRYMSFWVTPKD